MDIDHIKSRVIEFLRSENITSAQFAQEIGVQPSGISHIISGRNKPSLDFVVKMLHRYPSLSSDWLLFGKGHMFREGNTIDLFGQTKTDDSLLPPGFLSSQKDKTREPETEESNDKNEQLPEIQKYNTKKPQSSVRIVIFNPDGTFAEYFPE